LKFLLGFLRNVGRENYKKKREILHLKYLVITEFRFDVMLCYTWVNQNSDAGHIKSWTMSRTSETSLLFYVSCHQTYRNSLILIDPVYLTDSSLIDILSSDSISKWQFIEQQFIKLQFIEMTVYRTDSLSNFIKPSAGDLNANIKWNKFW